MLVNSSSTLIANKIDEQSADVQDLPIKLRTSQVLGVQLIVGLQLIVETEQVKKSAKSMQYFRLDLLPRTQAFSPRASETFMPVLR